ncbi:MAG: NRDE family protein [Rhodocyclaceae bacterium]
MCLILMAWRAHPDFPLVVAANRDEYYARPSAAAGFWSDAPGILAGRDLQAGGTWLGVTREGRFAALTNFRDPSHVRSDAPSRGILVSEYLRSQSGPEAFLAGLAAIAPAYNGFNLLAADARSAACYSNREDRPRRLGAGIYGLSNHLLDTPWPKVARAKSALARALDTLPERERFFDLLLDRAPVPDDELPRTGVSMEWERLLSAAFVHSASYGTRSSTVVVLDKAGHLDFEERAFDEEGRTGEARRFTLRVPYPTQPVGAGEA